MQMAKKKPVTNKKLTKTYTHKKNVLEALKKSLGVVTTACQIANVSRMQFYEWYNKDPDFKKQCDDVQNVALDFAESHLYKQIKDGNVTATIFYLKTKGKNRGYVERQEIIAEIEELKSKTAALFSPLEEEVQTEDNE